MWGIVGEDVTRAVLDFFKSGKLRREMNSTIITLVAKVPNPEKMAFLGLSHAVTLYIKCNYCQGVKEGALQLHKQVTISFSS